MRIGILGAGAIGSLLGGYITKGGEDVMLIEPFWREHLDVMKKDGLKLIGSAGDQVIKVMAIFAEELPQIKDKIELLFICVKSNDTEKMLLMIKPYLVEDAWVISIQNGINEDVIITIIGKVNTIVCSTLTGSSLREPGVVVEGGGGPIGFIVGELDGKITPRIKEVARIMGMCRRTEISTNIMQERWNKLAAVTMSGPVGAVSGLTLKGIFENNQAHRVFARILIEVMLVAEASGYKIDSVMGIRSDDWKNLSISPLAEVDLMLAKNGIMFPSIPTGTSADILKGRPLEIEYTNGYVVKRGKELDIATPVNELIIKMVREIESGKIKPGLDKLDEVLRLTA